MQPSSYFTEGAVWNRVPRVGTGLMLLALACLGAAILARIVPAIVRHVAEPCAGCYLGAFQPPLDRYRNPARQTEDGVIVGTTPPEVGPASQQGGSGHWLALAGVLPVEPMLQFGTDRSGYGASTAMFDNGTTHQLPADMGDFDHAPAFTGFATDRIGHEALTNGPMARALWGTGPVGRFVDARLNIPYMSEAVILPPVSLDTDAAQVLGDRDWGREAKSPGIAQTIGTPWVQRSVGNWRVAVQKDLQQHFLQIGTYETNASRFLGGNRLAATTVTLTGLAADANYQFIVDPINVISAHSMLVREARSPDVGTRANGLYSVDTFHAALSWGIADTVIPSIQYFRTAGSIGPNSAGLVAGISYVPWDGAGSLIPFLNLRIAAQYVTYTEFNGNARGASANNGVYLSLWGSLRF